jgi:hypothetical protein
MAATLDSEVVFKSRTALIGMAPASVTALVASGINSMAKLAFSCAYQVGGSDDASLIQVLRDALGAEPSVNDKAALRRLFFEATTMAMAEMKAKITGTEDSAPKKVPQPERASRYDAQVLRLSGMILTGELECAHSLIDAVFQQREDDVVRYISPDACVKRDQEVTGIKRNVGDPALKADVSNEMRTRAALTRRSLAYDQSGLISFACLEGWVEYLFAQIMRPAPEGFHSITLAQALQADRHLFMCLAGLTRNGIQPKPDGSKPLEDHIVAAKIDPQVSMLLMPLPGGRGQKHAADDSGQSASVTRSAKAQKGSAKGKGKGKAKGKRETGTPPANMPAELAGMNYTDRSGKPICFKFNLPGGCPFGERCRNRHICCKPGCGKNHSFAGNHVGEI